jgi:hypothetical protein
MSQRTRSAHGGTLQIDALVDALVAFPLGIGITQTSSSEVLQIPDASIRRRNLTCSDGLAVLGSSRYLASLLNMARSTHEEVLSPMRITDGKSRH